MNEKTTQARFMDAIAVERQRLASRRGFLRGAAKVAGGGALAVAAMPATGGIRSILAQEFTDDLEILNYALTLEQLEAFFYTEGLAQFSEDDFTDEDDDEGQDNEDQDDAEDEDEVSIYARLQEVRDHEQAHVETLTQTIIDLGGTPVEEGEYDFGDAFDDPDAFLETAQALENTGVSAYLGALPQIQDPSLVAAAGSIVTVEARHAGYLNDLNGESPFPNAFDEALSRDEVLDIVDEFIVTAGVAADPTETATAEAPAEEATETPEEEEPAETPTGEPEEPTEEPTEEPEEPTEEPDEPTEEPTEEIEDDVEVPEPTSTP
jgi:hypothetical protein